MEQEKNEDIETSENNEELEEELDEGLDEGQDEDSNESDDDNESEDDDNSDLQAKVKELEEKNKQLYARLKKTDKPNKPKKTSSNLDEEQLIRISKVASQLDDDDLEVLKTINGSSISDKLENPLFKAYKAEKQRKEKSKASSLKPSSPGRFKGEKDPNEVGITAEEHRARVEKLMRGE